jgi:hypothetical protein
MAGLAKNAAGQALCDDRLCPQNRPAICSLRNFVALLVPFLAPQFLRLQVEGYEIFIKFLPPSATGDTLKAFFSEARDSRSPDLSRSLQISPDWVFGLSWLPWLSRLSWLSWLSWPFQIFSDPSMLFCRLVLSCLGCGEVA